MATSILIEDRLEIPAIDNLASFRCWALSDRFPESGRIDFIAGQIEVDMAPVDLHTHGTPKVELVRALANRVRDKDLGELYTDRARVSCPVADLSVEPDIVFVSHAALEDGRVELIGKSGGELDRYVELEGARIYSSKSSANRRYARTRTGYRTAFGVDVSAHPDITHFVPRRIFAHIYPKEDDPFFQSVNGPDGVNNDYFAFHLHVVDPRQITHLQILSIPSGWERDNDVEAVPILRRFAASFLELRWGQNDLLPSVTASTS